MVLLRQVFIILLLNIVVKIKWETFKIKRHATSHVMQSNLCQNDTLYEHTIIFLKANDYHNPYFLTFISKSMLCITICCGEF